MAGISRDSFHARRKNPNIETLHFDRERAALAIYPGLAQSDQAEHCHSLMVSKLTCKWDNYHQSGADHVSLPGLLGAPGCPECLHFHWRWSDNTNLGNSNRFTHGVPAVVPGSPQTATIAVVAERASEADSATVDELLKNDEKLAGEQPVMYWTTFSTGITEPDGTRFDATFPILTGNPPGDRGSMWLGTVANADQFTAYSCAAVAKVDWSHPHLQQTRLSERLPAGYVVPVEIDVSSLCPNAAGPFYLSVAGGQLLNASPTYQETPFGTPYLEVRDDKYSPDGTGTFKAGSQSRTRGRLHAYAVFAAPPDKHSIHMSLFVSPSHLDVPSTILP